MNRLFKFLSLSIVFSLAGCVTLPKYVPPTRGPTAKLYFANSQNLYVHYFLNPYHCTGKTVISSREVHLLWEGRKTAVTIVPANRLITLATSYEDATFSCPFVVYSFVPKVNQHYGVLYGLAYKYKNKSFLQTLMTSPKCKFVIVNLDTNKVVPFVMRRLSSKSVSERKECYDALAKK